MTTILIVDDDDEIRELLEFDVAQSGYFVDTAHDGLEGLNKALNNSYDLILLDVMMPKMNGFDVCKNIRNAKIKISDEKTIKTPNNLCEDMTGDTTHSLRRALARVFSPPEKSYKL